MGRYDGVTIVIPVAQTPSDADSEIRALKEYQQSLGLTPTGNFEKRGSETMAAHRCYHTGKLELPPYALFQARGRDVRGAVAAIQATLALPLRNGKNFVQAVRGNMPRSGESHAVE